jgi:hypothetical protein
MFPAGWGMVDNSLSEEPLQVIDVDAYAVDLGPKLFAPVHFT